MTNQSITNLNMLSREAVLEQLRECYRQKDVASLKRKFYLYNYLLTDEDRAKILPLIEDIHPMVQEALKVLGGRLI